MLGLFKIAKAPMSTRHDTDKGAESVSDTPGEKQVQLPSRDNLYTIIMDFMICYLKLFILV